MHTALIAVLIAVTLSVSYAAAPTCSNISPGTILGFEAPALAAGTYLANPACNLGGFVNGNWARFGANGGISRTGSTITNLANTAKAGTQFGFIPTSSAATGDVRIYLSGLAASNSGTTSSCTRGALNSNWKPYYVGFWYSVQPINPSLSSALFSGAATVQVAVMGGADEPTTRYEFPVSWCNVAANSGLAGWLYYASPYFCAYEAVNEFTVTIGANSGGSLSAYPILIDQLAIMPFFWGNSADQSNSNINPPVDNLYLGCFLNTANGNVIDIGDSSATPGTTWATYTDATGMTVANCQTYCGDLRFPYASINAGVCNCGQTYANRGQAFESNCNQPCPGDSTKTCGGSGTRTYSSDYKTPYMGCYIDINSQDSWQVATTTHDIPKYITTSDGMSVEYCRTTCASLGYKFAGIQNRGTCACGNTFGGYGAAPDSQCNLICPDLVHYCGGNQRNSIWSTSSGEPALGLYNN